MSSPEDQSIPDSRRIRSRIAQQAYRKRHKEKFRSSQKRAQDLQVAAQHACTVFTDLTSALIRSGAIQNDTTLTTEVFKAIKEFHHVAKVVDEDGQQPGPTDADQLPPPDTDIPEVTVSGRSNNHDNQVMAHAVQLDKEEKQYVPHFGNETTSAQYQLNHSVYRQPPNAQILASPSYFALEFAINGDPSSIGSRLLHTTLSSGYEALNGCQGSKEGRGTTEPQSRSVPPMSPLGD